MFFGTNLKNICFLDKPEKNTFLVKNQNKYFFPLGTRKISFSASNSKKYFFGLKLKKILF